MDAQSSDDTDPIQMRVKKTYYDMHTNQTVEFGMDWIYGNASLAKVHFL